MSTAKKVLAAMEAKVKVKETKSGEYTSNSPLRPGSDSGAFNLKIEDGEHGAWIDRVTGQGGSLYELAALLNVPTPSKNGGKSSEPPPIDKTAMGEPPPEPATTKPAKPPGRSFASLAEYATYQGAPEQAFIKAGVSIQMYERPGDAKPTPHFVFPCSGDGIDRLRRTVGGMKPKWFPRKSGVNPQLYGWRTALNIVKDEDSPLVLTNGQTSTIVAQHFGIAAFCLTDGENKDIPDSALTTIIEQLDKGTALYIAKDGDEAGRNGMKRSYKQFIMRQQKPLIIDFGGDIGRDLANHCKDHKDAALPELLKLKTSPPPIDIAAETIESLSKGVSALNWEVKKSGDNNGDALQRKIAEVRKSLTVLENMNPTIAAATNPTAAAYDEFQNRVQHPQLVTGLKSGHRMLDIYISGFNSHAAYMVLGATGAGKSQLMATWARRLMEQAPGAIVSYECGNDEFVRRLNSVNSGIPFTDIQKAGQVAENMEGGVKFTPLDTKQIDMVRHQFRKLQELGKKRQFILPYKEYPSTIGSLYAYAKKMKNDYGIQWLIVDSLNNIISPGMGEREAMAQAAINCERMAVELGIAVIATAQPGRTAKDRPSKVLTLHDAKWSSEIEDKAYAHMSIYNHWLHVKRNDITEKPNDFSTYPKDTARLYINKSRGSGFGGRHMTLKYRGGVGFYNHSKKQIVPDLG